MKRICSLCCIYFCLLCACQKEDIRMPLDEITDWFAFAACNQPGELGKLIREVYDESELAILVNDTMGYINILDEEGNPVKVYQIASAKYKIYDLLEGVRFVLSKDTTSMIKAVQKIKDWVLPNLPTSGKYRTRSLLLVDSLLTTDYGGERENATPAWIFEKSIETTPVGRLADMKRGMNDSELKFWAGMILSSKVHQWLDENLQDSIKSFQKMASPNKEEYPETNVDPTWMFYNLGVLEYDNNYYTIMRNLKTGVFTSNYDYLYKGLNFLEHWEMGFLEFTDEYKTTSGDKEIIKRKVPNPTIDIMNYIAAVYAFDDQEFAALFPDTANKKLCVAKRLKMKKLVELFHESQGLPAPISFK